jgi:nicotinate-nucleotide adenylyltransferase
MDGRRIALFGGSFNPPHVGHLLAAAYVRAVGGVDAVWLMPAHRHPFGKKLVPFDDRVALCEALASHFTEVEVTRVEEEVPGEGRTIHTVEHLRQRYPNTRFALIVGTDILSETHKWFEFDRLVTLVDLIVLGRSGHKVEVRPTTGPLAGATYLWDVPMPEVSSTEVRARLLANRPVDHLVPASVLKLIHERKLYQA